MLNLENMKEKHKQKFKEMYIHPNSAKPQEPPHFNKHINNIEY